MWQLLPVKGIVNARDLGGYSIGADVHVRKGMLLRSAHLAGATTSDLAFLEGLGRTSSRNGYGLYCNCRF